MRKQLKKLSSEFCDNMKSQDKALLELLKQGHRALIKQIIKDYLLSYE